MSKLIDITGGRFGKLVIQCYLGSSPSGANWSATCDCGNEISVTRKKLLKGKKSCGCLESSPKYQNLLNKVKAANKNPKKYVYVASCIGIINRPLIKIGCTSNVYNRVGQLVDEFNAPFRVVNFAETRLACDLERALHRIFSDKRVLVKRKNGTTSREFFDIDCIEPVKYFHEVGAEVFYD